MRDDIAGKPVRLQRRPEDNWGPGYQFLQVHQEPALPARPRGDDAGFARRLPPRHPLVAARRACCSAASQLPNIEIIEEAPSPIPRKSIGQEYGTEPEMAAEVTTAEVFGLVARGRSDHAHPRASARGRHASTPSSPATRSTASPRSTS